MILLDNIYVEVIIMLIKMNEKLDPFRAKIYMKKIST